MPVIAGPILGAVTANSIRVWVRLHAAGKTCSVEYVPYGSSFPGTTVNSDPASGSGLGTVTVELTGLSPKTRYSYQIHQGLDTYGPWDFVTLPEANVGDTFDLYCISDCHVEQDNINGEIDWTIAGYRALTWKGILTERNRSPNKPCLCLVYGDFIQRGRDVTTATDEAFYESLLNAMVDEISSGGVPQMENYLVTIWRYIPLYIVWDDWDFLGNNSYKNYKLPGSGSGREWIRSKWPQQFPVPDYDTDNGGGLAHYIRVANVLIIITDARYSKDPTPGTLLPSLANEPPYYDGTLFRADYNVWKDAEGWGAEQVAWIKQVLLNNNDCHFLFFVVSQTMVDNVRTLQPAAVGARDSVGIYHKTERNDILRFVDQETDFNKILVITGDDHEAKIHRRHWYNEQWDVYNGVQGSTEDWEAQTKYYFKDFDWWEFKAIGGPSQELGNDFGTPEIYYSQTYGHFIKFEIDTTLTVPQADVRFFKRETAPNDVTNELMNPAWGRIFYPSPEGEESEVTSVYVDPNQLWFDNFEDGTLGQLINMPPYSDVYLAYYADSVSSPIKGLGDLQALIYALHVFGQDNNGYFRLVLNDVVSKIIEVEFYGGAIGDGRTQLQVTPIGYGTQYFTVTQGLSEVKYHAFEVNVPGTGVIIRFQSEVFGSGNQYGYIDNFNVKVLKAYTEYS